MIRGYVRGLAPTAKNLRFRFNGTGFGEFSALLAQHQKIELGTGRLTGEQSQRLSALALDLAQQLTVISHYADACDQLARRRPGSDAQSIVTWAAQIAEQIELGHRTIGKIQEFAEHG